MACRLFDDNLQPEPTLIHCQMNPRETTEIITKMQTVYLVHASMYLHNLIYVSTSQTNADLLCNGPMQIN